MLWGYISMSPEKVSVVGEEGPPGRSFHVDGPNRKAVAMAEPLGTAGESLVPRGISVEPELKYQKQSGEYGRVCKVEDGHRHN